jgi:hypothetical protein
MAYLEPECLLSKTLNLTWRLPNEEALKLGSTGSFIPLKRRYENPIGNTAHSFKAKSTLKMVDKR